MNINQKIAAEYLSNLDVTTLAEDMCELSHEIALLKSKLDLHKAEYLDRGDAGTVTRFGKVKRIDETTVQTFDSKAFDEAHPGLRDGFYRPSTRKASVRVS